MKGKYLLSMLIVFSLVLGNLTVYASNNSITLEGSSNGWVGKAGVNITALSGGTGAELDYKISKNLNDSFDNFTNNVKKAESYNIILDSGSPWYIYAKSGDTTKFFGPFNVDVKEPSIVLVQDGLNVAYVISEENMNYAESGYVFHNEATPPEEYTSKFTDLQGTFINSSSSKYLHVRAVDMAGNETTEVWSVNVGNIVTFVNNSSEGYCQINLGNSVNASRTTYQMKSESKTYETRSVTGPSSKVYYPTTGTYNVIVNVVMNDGRTSTVTSDTFSVSTSDKAGPKIEVDGYRRGSTVTLSDSGSGVDTARSYIVTMGDTVYFKNKASLDVDYSSPTVELVKVVAYDLAGNSSSCVFTSKYLEYDTVVDIVYESRTFFLLADGYVPSTNLSLDVDKLYYIYSGSRTVSFSKDGYKDIKFYIDRDIVPDELVTFDVFSPDDISWNIRNHSDYDLDNSYYQRNGKGAMRSLKRSQSIERSDFDYDLNFVQVTLVDDNGTEVAVKSRYFPVNYQSYGDNSSTSKTTSTPTSFFATTDVTSPKLEETAVRDDGLKYKQGQYQYISGYPDGNFNPSSPITRAEFVQILSSITEGGSATASISFSDVDVSGWYYPSLARMAGLGVAFSSTGEFRPNDDITRAEAAAMLNRLGLNPQIQQPSVFSDVSSHALSSDIMAAQQKGLIYGYADGTFKPDFRMSRVEAVSIINRSLGRASNQESILPSAKVPPDMVHSDWGYYDVVDALNNHTLENKTTSSGYYKWATIY